MAAETGNRTAYRSVALEQEGLSSLSRPAAKPRRYYDYTLVFLIVLISTFGLLMVYSSSYYTASMSSKVGYDGSYYLKKQAWNVAIGLVVMIVVSKLDYHKLVKWFAVLAYLGSIAVMVLTNFTSFGKEYNGAKRWFGIGNRTLFQPAELVKVGLIIFTAFLLVKLKNRIDQWKYLILVVLLLVVPVGLVAMNNLSSGIILTVIPFGMVLCASQKKLRWGVMIGLAIVGAVIIVVFAKELVEYKILKDYQVMRILVWKNPEQYSDEGGWQVLQGLYAIGSGGLFGKGIGNGTQKLGFVPEAQNDMIFSIICEELGIFGAICVILLFIYMFYRFMIIARNAPDTMGILIVTGVFIHIAVQVILNIAVVTNFIPNTGVTLPFISYGGTSILFLMTEVGLVLSVANRIELKG
ncbi:MAG: FtsW/RodA/SpoVE family cell cycle protein [Lachnospiraceae bacterium]|nr:FtsW/RodA/SpoVE family cell cycle protein [Lachnospiraceae bacterium]